MRPAFVLVAWTLEFESTALCQPIRLLDGANGRLRWIREHMGTMTCHGAAPFVRHGAQRRRWNACARSCRRLAKRCVSHAELWRNGVPWRRCSCRSSARGSRSEAAPFKAGVGVSRSDHGSGERVCGDKVMPFGAAGSAPLDGGIGAHDQQHQGEN